MGSLIAEHVRIRYQTQNGETVLACDDITVRLEPGESVVVVGPSGCGKTSFLNAVDGLVPIESGSITIDGREIREPGRDRAFVFQSPNLFPWRTVLGNVTYGAEAVFGRQAKQRSMDLIRLVGLEGFENKRPHQLSGGMQQRVNLARALAVDPDFLLLDEPFSALDAQTREYMQDELLRIWHARKEDGRALTLMFITHDIAEAVYLADRVIVLSGRPGRVIADIPIDIGTPRKASAKRTEAFQSYTEQIWKLLEHPGSKEVSA